MPEIVEAGEALPLASAANAGTLLLDGFVMKICGPGVGVGVGRRKGVGSSSPQVQTPKPLPSAWMLAQSRARLLALAGVTATSSKPSSVIVVFWVCPPQ